MGEIEYHSSLIYPVEKLNTSSKTLRKNLMEDNSCQILISVLLRVDCMLHFLT
ncbi:hypothetical protein BHE74_00008351 [Ensete ventricosum]|nr:hypothetical protein GW17_00013796 [Ensete ventricosum]RWW83146.1 hypothetical protein BHE74_00008351 [Ensete ventricosum]RZR87173.1 hypothetical protein BHM03_00014528 [Ensete ventricosum]